MVKKATQKTKKAGNHIGEWFAHRVYPDVSAQPDAARDQNAGRCPLLSDATEEHRDCVKPANSLGVCSVSSTSNGKRQDWLVCPYRALDRALLQDAARTLFRYPTDQPVVMMPAPSAADPARRARFCSRLSASRGRGILYMQNKLGGEISLAATSRSPELSFDSTLVEVVAAAGAFKIGRYGILEVQTMDFHGSYRHAVKNLEDALRLHGSRFPDQVARNTEWLAEKMEGPNIANVFKRTFYQMMFKFEIGRHPPCAGCILAIPEAVWDSWQRHLGGPELTTLDTTHFFLGAPRGGSEFGHGPAWIYVFDLDSRSSTTPNPIVVRKRIVTSAKAISHFALEVAPAAAVERGGSAGRLMTTILRRLGAWWPELSLSDQ